MFGCCCISMARHHPTEDGLFMLNLPYDFEYRLVYGRQTRFYHVPCSNCGIRRWKRASQRNQQCRSCSDSAKWQKRPRYYCTEYGCQNLVTTTPNICKPHRRKLLNYKKELARWTVSNAIKTGKLRKQPCSVCGSPRAEGHHTDYEDKLNVVWLCRMHHLEEHGGRFRTA